MLVSAMVVPGFIYGGLRGGQVGAYVGLTHVVEVPKELFRYDIEKGYHCFLDEDIEIQHKPSPLGTNFCTFWSKSAKEMRKDEKRGEVVHDNSECKIKRNKMC